MISYETYKMLHLIFIVTFFASLGLVATDSIKNKFGKIIVGLVSFLIMVAGMGLIARLGYKHSEPFPQWIKLKFIAWFSMNVLLILVFKFKNKKLKLFLSFLITVSGWFAIWAVMNKPV